MYPREVYVDTSFRSRLSNWGLSSSIRHEQLRASRRLGPDLSLLAHLITEYKAAVRLFSVPHVEVDYV